MNKNSPQYLLSASYGLIGYLTSSLAEYCAKRREHKLLYIIAGGLHLAIRRALNLKALSEAGWSEFLLTRLWSFSARAKERGKQPRMSFCCPTAQYNQGLGKDGFRKTNISDRSARILTSTSRQVSPTCFIGRRTVRRVRWKGGANDMPQDHCAL